MTVVVATASPDGIVLGSDSRTLERTGERARVSSDSTEKVYLSGAYGVATYGTGRIGSKTIRGLMDEFNAPDGGDPKNCADGLGEFFRERLRAATPIRRGGGLPSISGWPLGFLVAGYDDDGVGRVFNVRIRPGDTETDNLQITTANPGVVYLGDATDSLERMVEGVDRRLLRKLGLDENATKEFDRLRYQWIHPHTISDAIDLTRFLVETAISMRRFSDGTQLDQGSLPSAGGPVQTLAITRTGFRWTGKLGID